MDDEVLALAKPEEKIDSEVPKPSDKQLGVESGYDTSLPFSQPYEDKWEIFKTVSEDAPTARQLEFMRRSDGQARALYRLLTLPPRAALQKATFVPEDGGEKEAEFIDMMFTLPPQAGGMTTSFSKVMSQILLAVFDGFAAFEQVYHVPKKGPLKGKYTLQKLAHRPAPGITFLVDDHGGFNGFRQKDTFLNRTVDVEIARDNAFYFAAQEEERSFYGVSYFESAFYHYDKKVRLYYLAHLAAQRSSVGTRKGMVPANANVTDKNNFLSALANLGVAQYISLPPGYDVDLLKDSSSFAFLDFINHHNSQMSKSVLAAFFDKDQGGVGGKLVDFGTQSDAMFLLMLQALMDEIAAAINTYIIPKFIDWNFGTGKYPKFQWGTFTDEQKAGIQATFDKLAVVAPTGLSVTPQFMFELEKYMADQFDLEIDYEKIEKEKLAADEEAKKAQKIQLEQQQKLFDSQFEPQPATPVEPAPPAGQLAAASVTQQLELNLVGLAGELLEEARHGDLGDAGEAEPEREAEGDPASASDSVAGGGDPGGVGDVSPDDGGSA